MTGGINSIKALIWDLGNVFIQWDPRNLYDKVFDDEEKKQYFLSTICTNDWNEEQDGGRTIKEATESLIKEYPEWKEYIEMYYSRWEEMLGGPIEGTIKLFKQLKETKPYKHYALTNWSAELFPIALQKYEFLHWFDGRVVSGEEKMRKPFPKFYQLLLERFSLQPQETLFIDDNERNIKAAEGLGIKSILFTSPEQLRKELIQQNVL